jgi:hypothetical protein
LSKDPLDQTLDREPDNRPDEIAERTLNRYPAKKPAAAHAKKAGASAGEKPVAAPVVKPISAGKKPVAAPAVKPISAGKKPVAAPAVKPISAGKKPVAAPAVKPVSAGKKPVAAPPTKPISAADHQPEHGMPIDRTVELRSERRVEVIIPIEMQVVVEVPGAGKVRGATENMSCSGMLARLNGPVQPDSRCQVHFLSDEDVQPSRVYGRVIRIAKSRFGYSVAFRFERPVEIKVTPQTPRKKEL